MRAISAIYGLRAISEIHVGCESIEGVVDLPIQREKHTQWPVVFASSVKGALREQARQVLQARTPGASAVASDTGEEAAPEASEEAAPEASEEAAPEASEEAAPKAGEKADKPPPEAAELVALFGPLDPGRDEHRAGALLVGDMRLLALPVPALHGVYQWVCCPQAILRLLRDCRMYGWALPDSAALQSWLYEAFADNPNQALVAQDNPAGERIFLREYAFPCKSTAQMETLAQLFVTLFGGAKAEFSQRLLLVSDMHFAYLAQTATSVQPHIRLNEHKVTADKALWYEESLPAETLMYLPLAFMPERLSKAQQKASTQPGTPQQLRQILHSVLADGFLRIGANETTGMGWFGLHCAYGADSQQATDAGVAA